MLNRQFFNIGNISNEKNEKNREEETLDGYTNIKLKQNLPNMFNDNIKSRNGKASNNNYQSNDNWNNQNYNSGNNFNCSFNRTNRFNSN
jgi:hypothetical protein